MPLASGTRLGAYEIIAALGAGGMGEVYRARDPRLGREVAVKVLPEAVASSPDRVARFKREARTVAGLNHPNIVTLFSVEEDGHTHFLTMELVEGESLDQAVVPGGLPIARVLEIAVPLAQALAAAHERGIVHRDLKPANVMLTRDGRVKVLDFGLARLATHEESDPSNSEVPTVEFMTSVPGQIAGTVPYMAPEQIRGEPLDGRTDLFALGVLLYELLAGRRPFGGGTPADIGSAILRDRPEPLAGLRPDLSGDMHRIVERCLEKDPERRYPSATEVATELRLLQSALERAPAKIGRAHV